MSASQRSETGQPGFDPTRFHEELVGLLERTLALDLASYEEPSADRTWLLAEVKVQLEDAAALLAHALPHYDGLAGKPAQRDAGSGKLLQEVERRMARMEGAADIANLAFVAKLGLNGRLESLCALTGDEDRWEVVAAAGSAARELLKSMSALEVAICSFEGLEHGSRYYETEVTRSVKTRLAYAALRRDTSAPEPADGQETLKVLRRSAVGIAKLIGREIYPSLRVSDRIQIRDLQERLLQWLRGDEATQNVRAGLRLWQDLTSFVDLLQQVNQRAELKQHDRACVKEALARCAAKGAIVEEVRRACEALAGRDAELDELLRLEDETLIEHWRDVLRRLDHEITNDSSEAPAARRASDAAGLVEGDFF